MTAAVWFVFLVVLVALIFELINGFHDAANSIATVVATKVLTAGQGIAIAAVFELVGALMGTAVAKTIGQGLVETSYINMTTIMCALLGGIIWNLITWWLGLPSSSSHALMGGLCGAALAASDGNLHSIIWWQGGAHWWLGKGVMPKVILPMIVSPFLGFVIGYLLMGGLYALLGFFSSRKGPLRRFGRTPFVNSFFGKAKIVSASALGLSQGLNDAQKSMGIIALALAGATAAGHFDHLPTILHFLRIPHDPAAPGGFPIPVWVKVVCALTMAAGTAGGGWRIIKTLGHKMVKLHPINGFAAEGSSAAVILTASLLGVPV